MIGYGLEQVEAGEYEYPYEIYKVPVETDLFHHFVVTTALISTIYCIYQHQDIENNTAQYVTTVETGNGKEEVVKLVRRFSDRMHTGCFICRAACIEEMLVSMRIDIITGESAPQATDLVMKVRPFPGLAGKERDTADDRPQQPFDHAFTVVIVTGMYRQHHSNRAEDEDKGHQAHEYQWQVLRSEKRESVEYVVCIRPYGAEEALGTIRDQECAER